MAEFVQDEISDRRAVGEPWDSINSDLASRQASAAELGYQDDRRLNDRLTASAARDKATDQAPELKAGDAIPAAMRQTYADAMVTGETTGPEHFANAYHLAGHPPLEDMAAQLPSHEDLTDHSHAILADAELPLTAAFTAQTKANLLDTWAQTGLTPATLYQEAVNNPAVSDLLTMPPAPPPPPPEPEKQEGFFDPLKHGVAAVAGLFQPGGALDPIQAGKSLVGRIVETMKAVPEVPAAAGEAADANAGKPLAERLKGEPLDNAINMALGFSPASIGENLVNTFFRTPTRAAAAAEKATVKEFTRGTIREQQGLARQQAAQTSAALEEFRGDINKALPEYTDWLNLTPAGRVGKPVPMIANLIDHIEGVSKGVQLDPASPFAPTANALRDVYKDIRDTIETKYPDVLGSFYDDYYRHMWADPTKADRLIGGGRMGSGASTQMRTIPTMSDGLAQGLIPKFTDPLDNTIHYVSSMRNFIAQQETLRLGGEHGYVKYSMNGRPPEDGWVPLKGRSSEKQFIYQDAQGVDQIGTQQAYAHPGYAGSYNNWVGKGVYEYPTLGKIYDKLQYGANMLTGLKLSMSGYHAFNIAQESAVAGLADGIGHLAHGELVDAVKQIVPSVTILPQPVRQIVKGKAFQEQYLGIQDHGPELQQLTDLYARAGGRATGGSQSLIGQDNNMTHSFDVWNPSKWSENAKREFNDLKMAARPNPDNTTLVSGLLKTGRVGAEVGSWVGQAMGGLVKPMFENAIPKIKNAAFADEMSSWLSRNPMATTEAQLSMARRLVDSMDDRFGELVQDNLFWPRWVKQSLNLATISVGWEYGTMRAFGGAAKDILAGDLLSPRARWLYSFPLTMGVMGSTYQYLKTRTLPTQTDTPMQDLLAPRTGGTVQYGNATFPERAQMPGYQKDPEGWYFALRNAPDYTAIPPAATALAFNKLSPMWRAGYGLTTGKDPFTGNIIHAHPDVPGWKDYANFLIHELQPISMGQERMEGTNMSGVERRMGLRPIGQNLTDPGGAEGFQKFLQEKAQKSAQQYEAAHERKLEKTPAEPVGKAKAAPVQPQATTKTPPPVTPAVEIPDEESDGPPMPPALVPTKSPATANTHHSYDEKGNKRY